MKELLKKHLLVLCLYFIVIILISEVYRIDFVDKLSTELNIIEKQNTTGTTIYSSYIKKFILEASPFDFKSSFIYLIPFIINFIVFFALYVILKQKHIIWSYLLAFLVTIISYYLLNIVKFYYDPIYPLLKILISTFLMNIFLIFRFTKLKLINSFLLVFFSIVLYHLISAIREFLYLIVKFEFSKEDYVIFIISFVFALLSVLITIIQKKSINQIETKFPNNIK